MLLPFAFQGKKIPTKQCLRLLQKGCTVNLKGFKTDYGSMEGLIRFTDDLNLVLEENQAPLTPKKKETKDRLVCPICAKGTVVKGNTAYGCSNYKEGCDFRYSFATIREKVNQQPLTAELLMELLMDG
tara:strand:+ start:82129 stop:82512 length:384 start_codon:yes stop_codon:yes gene_type:complete